MDERNNMVLRKARAWYGRPDFTSGILPLRSITSTDGRSERQKVQALPRLDQAREGRDSNPRGSFTPPTRLAGGCFRPLSHLPGESGSSFDSIGRECSPYLCADGSSRWTRRAPDVGPRTQDGVRYRARFQEQGLV